MKLHPACFVPLLPLALSAAAAPSLVPDAPSTVPDYFCTWNVQGFVSSYTSPSLQADAMVEANLFGRGPHQNWVEFYKGLRGDLYFVLDDTWDIPLAGGRSHPMRGSLELDAERFPSYRGTPAERLARLNRDVRAAGWRGLGLWICSARARDRRDPTVNDHDYWAERFRWSADAGIDYWKVDWGAMSDIDCWRLNCWSRELAPRLWIEHGGLDRSGARMWLPDKIDIFRTYDVNISVAIPEAIRRIGQVLRFPREDHAARGLINCEDEVYIGAGLGCVYGVMRHPFAGPMPNGAPDRVFPADFRDLKRRLDEVRRAVRWHRLAQPFGVTAHELVDSQLLRDSEKGAGGPARIARGGLPLPEVAMPGGGEPPYVLCSRHPTGEIAIAAIGRRQGANVVIPRAQVTLEVGAVRRPVGIFGDFESLALATTESLAGRRILAQDLAGTMPVDITAEVMIEGGRLTVPGAVIRRIGLMAACPGDLSDPGLVLAIPGLTTTTTHSPMTPAAKPPRPAPKPDHAAGMQVLHARWGPVQGGRDVTKEVAAKIADGALMIDATVDTFGATAAADRHNRLELEYAFRGATTLVLAVAGERVRIEADGRYRTERAPRKPTPAAAPPSR